MTDFNALAARCEAATGPDRELDALIDVWTGAWPNTFEAEPSVTDEGEWSVVEREPDGRKVDRFSPARYTASLDAAMTLVPDSHHFATLTTIYGDWVAELGIQEGARGFGRASAGPLAICAAALRARAQSDVVRPDGVDAGGEGL